MAGRSHQAAQAVGGRTDTWPPRADTDTPSSSLPPTRDLQGLLELSRLCYRMLAPGRSPCHIPLSAATPYPFPTHLALGGPQLSAQQLASRLCDTCPHPGEIPGLSYLSHAAHCRIADFPLKRCHPIPRLDL